MQMLRSIVDGRNKLKYLEQNYLVTLTEEGSSRPHYVEALFWRRLWTCRQTEYWTNEWINRLDHNEFHQHDFVFGVFYFMCTDDTNVNKALQLIFVKRFRKVRVQQPFFAYW